MPETKPSDRTHATPATSIPEAGLSASPSDHVGRHTRVLLDGYALLRKFQEERRHAQEANEGAKTCTATRPSEQYDDRVQGWLRQVENFLNTIDPTGLLWCQFDQTLIPTRLVDPKNDVVPLGDYCHSLPRQLEALGNLLEKRAELAKVGQGGSGNALTSPGSPLDALEDPVKCVWVVGQVGRAARRSDSLARSMRAKNYPIVKCANTNYCQRKDAIAMFSRFRHRLIERTDVEV